MFKHANTWFPGARVRDTATTDKLAAEKVGSISDVDADLGMARISWDDKTSSWVRLEALEAE